MPVRSCGGCARCERAIGRSAASSATETSRKTAQLISRAGAGARHERGDQRAARERRQEEARASRSPRRRGSPPRSARAPSVHVSDRIRWAGLRVARPTVSAVSSARAKSSGSNGRRSSSCSPMPISFTGMPSSLAIASAMPPLAVPSSLVRTMPVTPTASPNSLAWRTPFWPVVASTVISVSCGASGICLAITRRTLASSSIRSCCVCRRPAVSTITTSAPRSRPRATASKATAPGSDPSGPLTTSTPARSRPALELLDGGGAERVGRADHDLLAERVAQVPGELADRRRLAGAVDADDEDHGRARGGCRSCRRRCGRARPAARRGGR